MLVEAGEYRGQRSAVIACTQLGSDYTATRARRVVDEWIELLHGQTSLVELQFSSRTPKRLFAALADQPQLTRLVVKWGDYADLSPLQRMTELRHLELRGAVAVADLTPLACLTGLEKFALEGFRTIVDPSPLGALKALVGLEIGGDWMSPRNGHLATIGFLRHLTALEALLLHTVIVDDLDYSPLLDLPRLQWVRVKKVRGMRPSHEELQRLLPWRS